MTLIFYTLLKYNLCFNLYCNLYCNLHYNLHYNLYYNLYFNLYYNLYYKLYCKQYLQVTTRHRPTQIVLAGCRHSSVVSSVPTILLPRVRVPSTPSTLLSLVVKFVLYLSIENNEYIQKKRPGLVHFSKKIVLSFTKVIFIHLKIDPLKVR